MLDDSAIDEAAFGVICIDADGVILRYNLYEARLARLDRNYVLGRNFFLEIARCTRRPGFEGRFRRFVDGSTASDDRLFDYVFDFAFGAQSVGVELHRVPGEDRYYLFINRRSASPVRAEATEIAIALSALVPNESALGVRRDALERRYVEAPATLFLSLRATFNLLAPDAWPLFASEWGPQWGRRVAIELEAGALAQLCAGRASSQPRYRAMSNQREQHDSWDAGPTPSHPVHDTQQARSTSHLAAQREPSVREYFAQFAWFGETPQR